MADGISDPSSSQHLPTDQRYFPNNRIIPSPRSEGAERKRPKHTRSKAGCLTCQRRKIKCDETKPNCVCCTHGSRKCSWPPEKQRNQQQKAKHQIQNQIYKRYLNQIAKATRGNPSASFSPHSSPISTTNTSLDPISASFLPRVRRGYWNRRGDHLLPDGHIVYSPPALAYPPELADYPLEKDGYQNEEGAFIKYAERPELNASLSLRGRVPERPYHTFVVYVDDDSRGSLSPLSSPMESSAFPHENKQVDEAGSPSKDPQYASDPWDLETRLAALNSRRPKSPTSSSSSYGSAQSVHSRASSFSGSAGGHIPGTIRDDSEFPFGYPIPSLQ